MPMRSAPLKPALSRCPGPMIAVSISPANNAYRERISRHENELRVEPILLEQAAIARYPDRCHAFAGDTGSEIGFGLSGRGPGCDQGEHKADRCVSNGRQAARPNAVSPAFHRHDLASLLDGGRLSVASAQFATARALWLVFLFFA